MDREKLDRWCERGILALVLSLLVFGPLAYGAVRTQEFVVIQCLTIAVLFLWLLRLWIKPHPVLFWPPVAWPVLAFALYAFACYSLAPIEYVARLEWIKILVYSFLFFAILNNLNRQDSAQIIVLSLIVLAFALSIFGIIQAITRYGNIWGMIKPEGYLVRASGTFINPNNFAGFLEMILPLALACTLVGRFSHVTKVAIGYAALVIVVAMGATLSRGGWISCALMLVVFFTILLFQRDFRVRSILVLALLLTLGIGAVATASQSKKRFQQIFSEGKARDNRVRYWNSAIQIWQENIWLGAGPAHYDYRFRQYRPADLQGRPQYVHNDYLNTLADWGIIGLTLVISFVVIFYIGVFKTWRFVQRSSGDLSAKSSNKTAFVLGGSLGLLALLFHSFVDFNLHIPSNAVLAITLFALVTTYLRFVSKSFWKNAGTTGKWITTLVAVSGAIYLGQQAFRQCRENLLLTRAAAEKDSSAKLALLQQAFAIEPRNFETAYAIGEIFHARSLQGNRGYEEAAKEAMTWFKRSMDLNPFNPFSALRYGMCLDWLDRHEEATTYFNRAQKLDPNGYYTVAHLGWHLMETDDLAGAKKQFERSQKLLPNPIAESYLEIIEQKLSESAAPAK